jgi:predicted phosphodiesterase
MRIAFLSDLHGNLLGLEAVLADIKAQGSFDQIVVIGDLVWSGPWPVEVVDCVQDIGAIVIQGNTDAFFGRQPDETPLGKKRGRFAEQLTWMTSRLGEARTSYLADLPFSWRAAPALGHDLLAVHANPLDLERPLNSDSPESELDLLLSTPHMPEWAVLAFGHVHIPFQRRWRDRLLVNVASAGLPLDGDQRAAYAILTWDGKTWQAQHRRVSYDVHAVAYQMRISGMPRGKHFAERLMTANYNGTAQINTMMAR